MKKCHNCKNGTVDGGSHNRIKTELIALEDELSNEISKVREKDHDKKESIIKDIKGKYNPLILAKSSETAGRISKCCICHGTGSRTEMY